MTQGVLTGRAQRLLALVAAIVLAAGLLTVAVRSFGGDELSLPSRMPDRVESALGCTFHQASGSSYLPDDVSCTDVMLLNMACGLNRGALETPARLENEQSESVIRYYQRLDRPGVVLAGVTLQPNSSAMAVSLNCTNEFREQLEGLSQGGRGAKLTAAQFDSLANPLSELDPAPALAVLQAGQEGQPVPTRSAAPSPPAAPPASLEPSTRADLVTWTTYQECASAMANLYDSFYYQDVATLAEAKARLADSEAQKVLEDISSSIAAGEAGHAEARDSRVAIYCAREFDVEPPG